jgi:uncharacterized protein (TIGR02099 family)
VGGEFTQGQVRLEGDLDRFPFDQPGSGIFTVGAQFERTTLRYRPEWPAISRIDGTLSIDRRQLDVKVDRAESKGVHLGASSIHVPDLLGDPLLQIVLSAEADADEALRYVKATPLKEAVAGSVPALQVEGRAALDMNLRLPYNHALDLRYAGTLQVNASRLAAVPDQPPLTQLSAKIQFDERSFNGRGSGQLLGGPADLTLVMQPDQGVVLTVQGTASLAAIAQAYSMPLQDRVQGQTGYRGTLVSRGQALDFVLDSDLRGVAIDLPAPFEKSADTALPLHIERGIRPAEAGASRDSLEIKLGQVLAATGAYREGAGGSRLERLGVGLGGAPVVLPGRRGVQINASLKTVDADRLMALVPAQGLPGAGTEGMTLSELALQTPELLLFGRRFAHVNLRAQSQAPHWVINMASDEATGSLTWSPEGHGRLSGQFSNLTVPQSVPGAAQQDIANSLPAMQIKAQRFTMNNRDFGRLELAAEDQDGGWRISHFSLEAPEGSITAEGLWRSQPGLGQVNVDVSIKASDAGKYLTRLGQPGTLQGGDATLNGHLRWNGVPYAVHYPSLEGEVELHAEKAQFLKVEPGVGRLLGVFSLQTLPRRITLDFRDVFSDGFAFDLVEASGQIHNGILTTHDFRMVGPAAAVSLDGTLDLAGETQNLRARIVPEVGGGLAASAGLALLNPVVGLGALIAQGFIKNPLGRLFAYDYDISGPWADPKVERVGEHPVAIGAEGGKPPGSATRAP